MNLFQQYICDYPEELSQLNGTAYMGNWYELNKTTDKRQIFEPDSSVCVQAQYYDLDINGYFTVENSL